MELKFNSALKYQEDAINSVIDLFEGQPNLPSKFTLANNTVYLQEEGQGNKFDVSFNQIEENFKNVQKINNLDQNTKLNSLDFTVEMETGTGKTYVYLRTILELNKHYGFSKFVIVVPSIAIKEGVKKTIDITRQHFEDLYDNIKYTDFIFDSGNLTQLEDFAREDNIQIMIITIQSFNRDSNKIKQKTEYGVIPIDFIRDTNPIIIIDEPQSAASTKKQKDAISELNPLFTLQYSATPKDVDNLIYKLDAVQAYNKNLVKKIEVDAFDGADYQGKPYMQLLKTKLNKKTGKRSAEMMLIKNSKKGFKKEKITNIKIHDNLRFNTDNDSYNEFKVKDISVVDGEEHVTFTNDEKIYLNQVKNDINQEAIRKAQIKETIREHLNKELKLAKKNIKVLSLFFIDEVKNYRFYDDNGSQKGKYAKWFEESYDEIIKEEKYQKLPDYIKNMSAHEVHDGYFSIDKKKWTNTKGNTKKDISTYEKIMKDKEKLLNPKDNLRFIFSHSTLKEGWDNPNVFQICTFIETTSDMSKRQKIGRGLRLCVDGEGTRIDENYGETFKSINRLTVFANESFDNFAKSLQKEMEEDGIQFNVVRKNDFVGIEYNDADGKLIKTNSYDAEQILKSLINQKLINKKDFKVKKSWVDAVNNDSMELPDKYDDIKEDIIQIVSNKLSSNYVSNKKDRITIKLNSKVFNGDNFNKLWDKIKFKTKYFVKLNSEELIESCVLDMGRSLNHIQKNKLLHTVSDLTMNNEVSGVTRTKRVHFVDIDHNEIPNIVKDLQDKTHLTRDTIIKILIKSDEKDNTFEKLLINPMEYFNKTLEIINNNLEHLLIKNIEYVKITGENSEYDKSQFVKEFTAYLDDKKLVKSSKSIYDYIYCDSGVIESNFANELENNEDVKLFVKLPNWFVINTPLSKYNPDWAITLKIGNHEETYFVIETKGTQNERYRRETENDKIKCGEKHFEVLDDVVYDNVVTCDEFLRNYAIY